MRAELNRRQILQLAALTATSCLGGKYSLADRSPAPSPERWVGFRNGPSNLGVATTPLPENPKLLWEIPSPDGFSATPVIDGNRVYMGSLSGDLLCLDLATGAEIWKYKTQEVVPAGQLAPGFNAPLTLGEELIYAGDDQGTMHAVDKVSGQLRWKVETASEIVGGGVLFQPAGSDSARLIFGSHAEKLFSIDCHTGELLWTFNTNGPVNATPTLADRFTFVTGCSEPLMYVIDVTTGEKADEIPLEALLIASAAERDGILYFGTDGGVVFALDRQQKQPIWKYSVPDREFRIQSSPAVTAELVLIGSQDKHLHAIDRITGKARWEFRTRAKIDSSPVVCGDRVYFGGADKTLYALSLTDGRELWKFNAGQSISGSPAIAAGKMVVGTELTGGRLLCFG